MLVSMNVLSVAIRGGEPLEVIRAIARARPALLREREAQYGRLPLRVAAEESTPEVVRFVAGEFRDALEDAGTNGLTPVMYAAHRSDEDALEVVQILAEGYPM